MIDINYASRDPQIVIHQSDGDDPRDKLISMFTGEAMPGVRDGYCRIERYPNDEKTGTVVVITPIHPVEMIKHIPLIIQYASENAASDTAAVPETLLAIIEAEHKRLKVENPEEIFAAALEMIDHVSSVKMPPELHKRWHSIMYNDIDQ